MRIRGDARGLGRVRLLGVPSPRYSYPQRIPSRSPCVVCATATSVGFIGLRVTWVAIRPVACCLIPTWGTHCFQRGRTLEPSLFRALDYIGIIVNVPTLRYTQFRHKYVWRLRCDGTYPRRERRGIVPVPPINQWNALPAVGRGVSIPIQLTVYKNQACLKRKSSASSVSSISGVFCVAIITFRNVLRWA